MASIEQLKKAVDDLKKSAPALGEQLQQINQQIGNLEIERRQVAASFREPAEVEQAFHEHIDRQAEAYREKLKKAIMQAARRRPPPVHEYRTDLLRVDLEISQSSGQGFPILNQDAVIFALEEKLKSYVSEQIAALPEFEQARTDDEIETELATLDAQIEEAKQLREEVLSLLYHATQGTQARQEAGGGVA